MAFKYSIMFSVSNLFTLEVQYSKSKQHFQNLFFTSSSFLGIFIVYGAGFTTINKHYFEVTLFSLNFVPSLIEF
jgi:hypothetical protein